jgi:hypothetical protein
MSQLPGAHDPTRVDNCFVDLMRPTGLSVFDDDARASELDNRIQRARLCLADKAALLKRLAPRAEDSRLGALTGERKEVRIERLFLSITPEDLPAFKFALEYDADYKDLEEYVFHDVDDLNHRGRILEHLARTPSLQKGVKVLSDVDDTMYANLIDKRYPPKTLYPGVLEFYDAVKEEPFEALPGIPLTTLSARPNPIAGILEEASLQHLAGEFTCRRLRPSGLSGALLTGVAGTLQTLARDRFEALCDHIPEHDQEDGIGRVKFANFCNFSDVYPEYRYVFVGDSGQADALTAGLMVTRTAPKGTTRVATTFIHNLQVAPDDNKSASASFRALPPELKVGRSSANGRGVIVFRNYIEAALIAQQHSKTLQNLVTADELGRVTQAALEGFQAITFPPELTASRQRLREQYLQDAEHALTLLPAHEAAAIRHILNRF